MNLQQRRFLFITGKGGVGKNTVAAANASAEAARGRRVLIALSEAKERLSTLFGVAPLGAEIRGVAPGISAVRIDPERALSEYGQLVLKSRHLHRAVFESKVVTGFFRGIPGLSEWSVLGKAWYHSTEQLPDGRPRFDLVLFDAPATGHGVEMLLVPKLIVDVIPPGILRRDAERAWELFRDPEKSGVVVVTLAEEMPATETRELASSIREDLGLPIAALVVNALWPPLFDPNQRRRLLERPLALPGENAAMEAIAAAVRRAAREEVQAQALERLAAIEAPRVSLPLLLENAATPAAVRALSAHFQ